MMTTLIQVFSRIFLTWGVVDLFPSSVRNCPAYPVMLVAWSTTEVIRYSFYAWNLLDEVPYPLLWLRYRQLNPVVLNTFHTSSPFPRPPSPLSLVHPE
jgi:Protein tyrosine phosphatase-like protein, PTPLA